MAPHSSTLAWKTPWMEEPGGLQSMGSLGVRNDWAIALSLFTFMHWRRRWQPTPVFLPGESQGWRSLVGCRLWGRKESDTTEVTSVQFSSVQSLSHVWLFATPWTVACQAPLSMGILQARILEWVATPSSRVSSQPRDQTQVSCIAGGFFTFWATRILEWVACSFSRRSSWPRNQTRVSCIAGGFFTSWATREAP